MKKLKLCVFLLFIYSLVFAETTVVKDTKSPYTVIETKKEEISTAVNLKNKLLSFLNSESIYGLSPKDLLYGILIFAFAFALAKCISKVTFFILKKILKTSNESSDHDTIDAFEPPLKYFILFTGIKISLAYLGLYKIFQTSIQNVYRCIIIVLITWASLILIDKMFLRLSSKLRFQYEHIVGFLPLFARMIKFIIMIIGFVLVLDNLGFKVGGIFATLGIGGAALALAAKDTIANIYGSIAIALDRPFKVGDVVNVGGKTLGHIETIGFRSTQIRTKTSTLVSVPNNLIANEYLDNNSKRILYQVEQTIGLSYDVTSQQMKDLLSSLRAQIQSFDIVDSNSLFVNFAGYGESSLNILLKCSILTDEEKIYRNTLENINLLIMEIILEKGLKFAHPTRTIYLNDLSQVKN